MPKAILELEMPENCKTCPCCRIVGNMTFCEVLYDWSMSENRHPDCPLKLVEGKGVEP